MPTFSYLAGYELVPVQSSYSREKSLTVEKIMRLSRDNLKTQLDSFSQESPIHFLVVHH